jgi:hypothetical protein
MPRDYWHCSECNGNFDHGEKCDCEINLKVSETIIIGVDISNDKDISCVQVAKQTGSSFEVVNTFYGEEAEKMYEMLTNRGGVIAV